MMRFMRRRILGEDAIAGEGAGALPRGLNWRLTLAWAAVAWERLWRRLWRFAAVVVLFVGFALLGVPQIVSGWVHLIGLLVFTLVAAGLLVRGLRGMTWPDAADARRRLERDSGLSHRPLSGLRDTLATGTGDPAAAALWRAHRERLGAVLARLRVGPPRGSLSAVDPLALRAIPVLVLVAGLLVAGSQAPHRLMLAFMPQVAPASADPAQLDVWIDPPDYTGHPPRFLRIGEDAEDVVRVPEGSRLMAQVVGGRGTPEMQVGPGEEVEFEAVADSAWSAAGELNVDLGGDLRVAQDGRTLGQWTLHVMPDHAPEVSFLEPPERGERGGLRVGYEAMDDYGLASVRLRIEREGDDHVPAVKSELPLPSGGARAVENVSQRDFTDHVWAGLEVQMTLVAEDAIGQTGTSETITAELPERSFQHPVARALVDLRRQLTLNPERRAPVAQSLAALNSKPETYDHDSVVTLALSSAERRLLYDRESRAIGQVQGVLWETALRIEDGELAIAERDLRDAERELMDALSRDDVSMDDLERLMSELESALDRFLEALAEEMRERMAAGEEFQPLGQDADVLDRQDLQEMMQQMRDLAEMGQRDTARDMLQALQEMLRNLHMEPMTADMGEQLRQAMEMMRSLESLTQEQQELLDQTFQRFQEGQGGDSGIQEEPLEGFDQGRDGEGNLEGEDAAGQQEALRQQLGQLMRELGDALGDFPRSLGQAEQDMRGASEALRGGRSEPAMERQNSALDNLRQGMESMEQAFQDQMMGEGGQGQGSLGWQPGQRSQDPFGRSRNGTGRGHIDSGDVDVPDQMELHRARQILDELRRRSGERERPEHELDYIDRLLRQF